MDKGNHYYKCDLQMHSPRDINWTGGEVVSESERSDFAIEFIKRCRAAELDAVAITDHHDLCFFPYIREAAKLEADESGNVLPEGQQLIVFPGIELTLSSPPCQGLLILDADFPESLFPTILGALSLAQAPSSSSKTQQTLAIPASIINSIADIYSKLDGTDGIRGRYIFLPHVKDGGHQTLMRQGFHHSYASMPCVGGYLDGKLQNPTVGYQRIVNGEVDAWGFKSIAVLQTSDHRSDSPLVSDTAATWIKFKKPTAEALRQACLAKESRISLQEPELPNIYIEKIDVTNSAFLSNFEIDFNPQLNSIIGGRGSGKSTVLEYLRWCLCDQTDSFGSGSIENDVDTRRANLIEKTLSSVGGEVRVFFNVNGTRHIVKRNPKSEDVLLKIGDSEFQSVRPSQIRSLLPIQAYSQKQLSNVSIKSAELKRLIEQPVSEEILRLDEATGKAIDETISIYTKLSEHRSLSQDIQKIELESESYKQQIEKMRSGLKGLTEDDKKILTRAELYSNEKNSLDEVAIDYDRLSSLISEISNVVGNLTDKDVFSTSKYENTQIIGRLSAERAKHLAELKQSIESLASKHEASRLEIRKSEELWLETRNTFYDQYKKAKENSSSSEIALKAIKDLEKKIEELALSLRQKRSKLEQTGVTENSFGDVFQIFLDSLDSRLTLLKESATKFSDLSESMIAVDFSRIVNYEKLADDISNVFSSFKLNIQTVRSEAIAEKVREAENPIERWGEIVNELRTLSEHKVASKIETEIAATPLLDSAGFTMNNKRKIVDDLTSSGFVKLATISLEFVPQFLYKTNNKMEDTVPFEDASAGQQATALLNVLLNQDGFPLVIDQPEDDIDNRAIEKIVRSFWRAKQRRQIIVSSHNANLVVNGDSELVVSCDYNETSEQTRGKIKHEGSIDDEDIRNEITSIMEGGEKAFKLRKEKYGF